MRKGIIFPKSQDTSFFRFFFYNELLRNDRDIHNFITRIEQHFHDTGMVWPLETTADGGK